MTFAVLNRDGSFREWVSDPDLALYRQGSLIPQSVDALPAFDPDTQEAVEGSPVRSGNTMRKTWVVAPKLSAPRTITPRELWSRLTPDERSIVGYELAMIMAPETSVDDPEMMAALSVLSQSRLIEVFA